MIHVHKLTFNPYQENTYVLALDSGECAIVDPGMYGQQEEEALVNFLDQRGLNPVLLLNTHCHVDHVLGNRYVFERYGLMPKFTELELPVLMEVQNYAPQMGFRYEVSPIGEEFLPTSGSIALGTEQLEIVFAPGHSPGHVCFYAKDYGFLIGGDVLFYNSIGRTDLPGGNHEQLLSSIREKIYALPDDTIVYPGHGPETQIGFEKQSNPFVRA